MRIGIDCDGILYQWEPTARLLLRQEFGIEVSESQSWNHIKDHVPADVWRWLWGPAITEHGLFRHGSLYKGTVTALRKLEGIGRLVLITSRPKLAVLDTLSWIAHHRLPFSEVHILSEGEPKSRVACDVYLDDNEDNVVELAANTHSDVYLWDRPWNQRHLGDAVVRVNDWDEFISECGGKK